MIKLVKYLKGYLAEAIMAPLFKSLEAVFELLVPMIVARIIDLGIGNKDDHYIVKMSVLLLALGVLGWGSSIIAQYFSAKAAIGMGTALRDHLFRHVMSLPLHETDKIGRSSLITRLTNDTNQVQDGVNRTFRLVLRSPLIVLGSFIMAAAIKLQETMIFGCVILLLSIIVAVIMKKNIQLFRIVQSKLDAVLNESSNNLTGVRIIRAFSREKEEIKLSNAANERLATEQIHASRISALMNPLTYVVVNMGIIAILRKGSLDVQAGTLSRGEVVALINYMSQILTELIKFANVLILMSKASASAKRINEVFALTDATKQGMQDAGKAYDRLNTDSDVPAIEFQNVGFAYPGSSKEAISNISFRVKSGETLGIIGGTGSGKSTIIKLMSRFYDATGGRIMIAGENIEAYSLSSLRKTIGIVEQNTRLFQGTIASNLRWGKQTAGDDELMKAVTMAQGANIIAEKRNGLLSEVQQLGRNYSGGQRQRLSIARALVHNPKILILDDASSALDFMTEAALRKEITAMGKDTTVINVTQRVSGVINADAILVLDNGRMVGFGRHEELIKSCEVYQEICLSQLTQEEVAL
jgi:ABC-type multidrug transport system fused ATPase/permease subunit